MFLKQSTAFTFKMGPMLDSTDGNTEETALTFNAADVKLSKNGGALAAKNEATNPSHDANGQWTVTGDATDSNTLGHLRAYAHVAGALYMQRDFFVLPAAVYDAIQSNPLLFDLLTKAVTSWHSGTAQAGAAGSITFAAGASAVTDFYKGGWVFIHAGTGAGQGKKVSAYNGTTKVASVADNWATNPDNTSQYIYIPEGITVVDANNPIPANTLQVNSDTAAAQQLSKGAKAIVSGAAIAGTLSTTQMTTNLTEVTNDHYKDRSVVWRTGNLAGQAKAITAYNGATKMLTFQTATEAPAAADEFDII